LAGVVLTKDAQAAVGKAIAAKPAGSSKSASGTKSAPPSQARAKAVAAMQTQAKGAMTAERQALIQHALKVRAAKKAIVGELSDEARANLVGITLIGLMHADKPEK
jgi:hypothetical protein